MAPPPAPSLTLRLAAALPAGLHFTIHHLSEPPANCPPLFSAPPGQDPEPTECESHFLSVSIPHWDTLVQVFAIEVLIYTSATLTTIFVSKADSTGYLHLVQPPAGYPSPVRTVTSTFLTYLVEARRRPDARLVLSLFARAQNQYLFPGSIENHKKHVLDDRGLIKWWCRIFDSILLQFPTSSQISSSENLPLARGYLIVPGCDAHETRSFFPRAQPPSSPPRWLPNDPLRSLGKSLTLPERCLIPRFPDDPKARFALDLDDELPENGPRPHNSPEKNPHPGKWRSVRSLEQFWELMAFRQECAAGRLVGFLWGVFESQELREQPGEMKFERGEGNGELERDKLNEFGEIKIKTLDNGGEEITLLPTPRQSQIREPLPPLPDSSPASISPSILPISPMPSQQVQLPDPTSPLPSLEACRDDIEPLLPSGSAHQSAPTPAKNGSLRLAPPAYTSAMDLLLQLDYADLEIAKESTNKFIDSVGKEAGVENWGVEVVGKAALENGAAEMAKKEGGVAVLGTGLIRKKKRPAAEEAKEGTANGEAGGEKGAQGAGVDRELGVRVLSASMVRKKPKVI